MARKVKDKLIGARVDGDMLEEVNTYINTAEISMGDLIRVSVLEYMTNHPVVARQEA